MNGEMGVPVLIDGLHDDAHRFLDNLAKGIVLDLIQELLCHPGTVVNEFGTSDESRDYEIHAH